MKNLIIFILTFFCFTTVKCADILISTPTVWNSSMVINDNIRILPGGKLIINNNAIIEMASGKFIETRPSTPIGTLGGQLVLHNCTIKGIGTSGTWTGISIIGNSNFSQQDSRMSRLNVIDNVLIQGAAVGIANYDFTNSSIIPNTEGGIISATGLTIEKSAICVYMEHYQNFDQSNPSIKLNDVSAFRKCNFRKTVGGWVSFQLIVLDEVQGITFAGCTFEAVAPFVGKIQNIDGVNLRQAGAIFTEYTDPMSFPSIIKNRFINLNTGIWAINNGTTYRILIKNCEFYDNQFAILLDGAVLPYIIKNEIEINPFIQDQAGIVLQSTKQYTVMENTVSYTGSNTSNRVFGININNGGDIAEDVYKNNIMNCNFGLKADGENRHASFQIGLRYICNELNNYDPPAYDIYVDGGITNPNRGIAVFQGVLNSSGMFGAQNDFSGTLNPGNSIVNNSNQFNYIGPLVNFNGFLGPVVFFNEPLSVSPNTCPSKICEFPCNDFYDDLPTYSVVSSALIWMIMNETDSSLFYEYLMQYEELVHNAADAYLGEPEDVDAQLKLDSLGMILLNAPISIPSNNSSESIIPRGKELFEYHLMRVGLYVQQKEYTQAIQLLHIDKVEFNLSEEKIDQINDLIQIIELQEKLYTKKITWDSVPKKTIEFLNKIADLKV